MYNIEKIIFPPDTNAYLWIKRYTCKNSMIPVHFSLIFAMLPYTIISDKIILQSYFIKKENTGD